MGWFLKLFASEGIAWGVGIAAALAVATIGGQWVQNNFLETKIAKAESILAKKEAGWSDERTKAAELLTKEVTAMRARETAAAKRADTAEERGNALEAINERDRALYARTAGRMRDTIEALRKAAGRAPAPPGTAASGPTPEEAAGMLANLCQRANERSGVLAEYADRLHVSAETCLRAWPLNPGEQPTWIEESPE